MFQNGNKNEDFEMAREQKVIDMQNRRREMVKRSDEKKRLREVHIKRRETEEAEKVVRLKEDSDTKIRQMERAHRLAEELTSRKNFERQELIKKKRAAFAALSLPNCAAINLEEKLLAEKQRDDLETSKVCGKLWFDKDPDHRQVHEKKLKYKRELQEQMIDNRRRLFEKQEEKFRERKIIEEITEVLRMEDIEVLKRKRDTAILLRKEKDVFMKARQFWKAKRREVFKKEHEEISKLIAEREAQIKSAAEKQTDTRETKEAMAENIARKIMEEQRRKEEREAICRELYLAEKENQLAQEAIKNSLRKKSTAKELLQDMVRQQKAAAEKNAKEVAIDAAFRRYLAKEKKAMDEKEKLEKQARKEKALQYGNELRETIARNKMNSTKSIPRIQCDSKKEGKEESASSENRELKCFTGKAVEAV